MTPVSASRERIALIVFIALLAGLVAIAGAYISHVGRGWNVAASNIDDATGKLEDYTAIVYAGTAEKQQAPAADGQGSVSARLNALAQSVTGPQPEGEKTAADALAEDGDDGEEQLSVDALRLQYQEKGAACIVLDVENPHAYDARTVVRTPRHSFGIMRIDADTPASVVWERIAEYERAHVDFVVAVVSDLSLAERYPGLDIVVSALDEGLLDGGVNVDGVFYADAAAEDEVGSILITPSKLITARDVDSL